jgi:hypothetical protein
MSSSCNRVACWISSCCTMHDAAFGRARTYSCCTHSSIYDSIVRVVDHAQCCSSRTSRILSIAWARRSSELAVGRMWVRGCVESQDSLCKTGCGRPHTLCAAAIRLELTGHMHMQDCICIDVMSS